MESIELLDYVRIIRKRLGMIIAITVIATVTSAILSYFVIPKQYEATTTILVNDKQQTNQQMIYNDIMANEALVKTYNEIIKSRTIADETIAQLGLNMTADQLDKLVAVSAVDQSQVISITVTDKNPQLAVNIANTLAETFKAKAVSLMQVQNVSIVDKAVNQPHPIPVSPKTSLNTAITFVLGLMVSVGMAFLLEYLDDTIKSEADIEQYLQMPVLGVIAVIDETESQGATEPSKAEVRASQREAAASMQAVSELRRSKR